MPQRKTKCPFCEKPIFVKRRVDENIKRLVTKEEADRIQEEWNARYSEKSFNSFIDEIGMGKAYIDQLHVKFKQKTGDRYSVDDFKIQLINQRIDQLVKKHDYHAVKILYNKLYNILWSKDLDYYHPLKMTCFFELLEYKQGDIFTSVEISITNPCEECKKLDGKIFSLEDMIKDSILPNQKCLKKYCSCVYLAVIDE